MEDQRCPFGKTSQSPWFGMTGATEFIHQDDWRKGLASLGRVATYHGCVPSNMDPQKQYANGYVDSSVLAVNIACFVVVRDKGMLAGRKRKKHNKADGAERHRLFEKINLGYHRRANESPALRSSHPAPAKPHLPVDFRPCVFPRAPYINPSACAPSPPCPATLQDASSIQSFSITIIETVVSPLAEILL